MKFKLIFLALALFASVPAFAGTITVSRPVRGTLALGEVCAIHWTAQRVNDRVKIQLIQPGGALVGRLANRLAAGGSPFNWTVAAPAVSGGSYRVRVSAMDNSASGESEVFTISANPVQPGNPGAPNDPPPPLPALHCDLGIGDIIYRNGDVIVPVVNNGPDPLSLRDVKISMTRHDSGIPPQVIVRQLAIPPRQHVNLTLAHVPPATIPNSGIHFSFEVDAAGSGVSDLNPLNQRRGENLCLLDIRCRIDPADLVLTMSETANGREYRVRYKVRVSHNLDRPVENVNVFVFMTDAGRRTRNAPDNWTIPAIAPGVEWVRQVDRTYGELGRDHSGRPVLCPGAEHRIALDLCELGLTNCDIDFNNNRASLIFFIPE
jgi:hypothetical protein